MKKLFLIAFIGFISISAFSQEKNSTSLTSSKFNIGLSGGIGIYGGKTNDKSATNDSTAVDAACAIIKLHTDYSLFNKFTIGFVFERNGFLTNKDSSNSASSLNIGITAKYKFINKEFNKLFIELMPAYSYFTYQNEENHQKDKVESNGFNFQVGLGWDHYFGKHLGIYLGSYYTIYKYNKIVNADNGEPLLVNYPPEEFNIKLSGVNLLKLGLLYRF